MKLLPISIMLVLSFVLTANAQYEHHHSEKHDSDFKNQFSTVIDHYLAIKDALVESNAGKAARSAEELFSFVRELQEIALDEEKKDAWHTGRHLIMRHTNRLKNSNNLNMQRIALNGLSLAVIEAVSEFGLEEQTLFKQYCSMALGDGGIWLSESEDIANPYYGSEMLTCGENVGDVQ